MELELGLKLLLQALPAIAQIFTALQEEKSAKLKLPQARDTQKFSQQQLAAYERETQLELAARERETALRVPEIHKILNNWPLTLLPSQLLDRNSDGPIPLRIFLSPPKVQLAQFGDVAQAIPEIELNLAQGLGEFLSQNYPLDSGERPIEFLAGAWENKGGSYREASIKALFEMLKSEPTLILELEFVGNYLNLRIAYWGLGQKTYCYQTIISRLNYREIVYASAKSRALRWKETADKLLACGESTEEVNKLGGDNATNLELLLKEEKWQRNGIDISELPLQYKVNNKDFEELCQLLIIYYCVIAGWIVDAHHLIHYDVTPLLPELLPCLTKNASDQKLVQEVLQKMISGYKNIFNTLEQSNWRIEHQENVDLKRTSLAKPAASIVDLKRKLKLESVSLVRTFTGHSGRSSSIAINLDGRTIASGSDDNTIKLWDLGTGELLNTFTGNSGRVLTITLSPDGQTLASSNRTSDKSCIKIWNLSRGELLRTLTGHNKWIYSLAISPDGQTLVSGGYKIKIWNLSKGEVLHTLAGHKKSVYSLAISPDGQTLVSSGGDKTIKIWHLSTGELLHTLVGHSDWIRCVAISSDGQILASGSDDNTIKLWHLATGRLLRTLVGHSDWVLSVAISPCEERSNQQTLISGSKDNTIKLWHLGTGKLLRTLTGHNKWVYSLALSPDGQILASGSEDKTIKIWRAS